MALSYCPTCDAAHVPCGVIGSSVRFVDAEGKPVVIPPEWPLASLEDAKLHIFVMEQAIYQLHRRLTETTQLIRVLEQRWNQHLAELAGANIRCPTCHPAVVAGEE